MIGCDILNNSTLFAVSVSLSLAVIAVMVIKSIIDKKKYQLSVKNFFITSAVVVFILIFPQYYLTYERDLISTFVYSLLFSLKSVTYGQSLEFCRSFTPDNKVTYTIYYALTYIDYLVMPIFTMSFLVEIFGNITDKVKFKLLRKSEIIVLSELNENSLNLAETLKKTRKNRLIFCEYNTKANQGSELITRARKLNAIVLESKSHDLTFNKYVKKIDYYEISENKEKNIHSMMDIIDKNESNKNKKPHISLYLFSEDRVTENIIEGLLKKDANQNIDVIVIDELRHSCYQLLYDKPIYESVNHGLISVLIIGAGKTGLELAKSSLWCGQLSDIDIKVTVVDSNPKTEACFFADCPELTQENGYNIKFITANVKEQDFYNLISQHCNDATYIAVCMSDDKLNICTAMKIREFYEKRYSLLGKDNFRPQICVRVKNEELKDNVKSLSFGSSNYDLYPFGSITDIFKIAGNYGNSLCKTSEYTHLTYCIEKKKKLSDLSNEQKIGYLFSYHRDFYSQRSSTASAVHIKYKLFDISKCTDLSKYDEEGIKNLTHDIDANIERLSKIEHRRWMAFIRSEGYTKATIDDVKNYIGVTNGKHKFDAAKMHPCLVPWDDLDNLYYELSKIEGIKMPVDFKQSDMTICYRIPEMLEMLYNSDK